jgi:uncharacterized membrane protein
MRDSIENPPPDVGSCLRYGWALYQRDPWLLSLATVLAALINFLASWVPFASMLTYMPLLAGLYLMVVRIDDGRPTTIGNLFDGFQYFFLPLVVASVLTSLLITLGIILLVLPGIYLALAYGFVALMIVDRKLDFWPAMEASRKLITAHFWQYLLLALLLGVVLIVSCIPFGLGLPIAVPVCLAAHYHFYRALVPAPAAASLD